MSGGVRRADAERSGRTAGGERSGRSGQVSDEGPRDGEGARRLRETAAEVFGWDELRPEQLTAMEWVLEGRDALVVMPTGSGKSAVYQVPGLLLSGPVVVVSPLLALQRDQIAGLPDGDRGPAAVAVNSDLTAAEEDAAWTAVREGEVHFLYLSPEQLAKDEVVDRLAEVDPALFVVDEAQCVSSWGHDFRPDYLRLAQAARRLGGPPVLALTATAAPPVRQDIVERLGMRDPRVLVTGFDRPNIRLEVRRHLEDAERRFYRRRAGRRRAEARHRLRGDPQGQRVLRRGAGRARARRGGVPRGHARLRTPSRPRGVPGGETDVVVATSAFGMGIDKEDVRFVLHAALPGSLDAYYQEVGRCGRDGKPALAVLHYRPEDTGMQAFFSGQQAQPGHRAQGRRRGARPRRRARAAGGPAPGDPDDARPGHLHREPPGGGRSRRHGRRGHRAAGPRGRPGRRRAPGHGPRRGPPAHGALPGGHGEGLRGDHRLAGAASCWATSARSTRRPAAPAMSARRRRPGTAPPRPTSARRTPMSAPTRSGRRSGTASGARARC